MEIPVYLFVGFLESGKTSFIQKSLEYSDFNSGENTLYLICEEGIEELDIESLPGKNIFPYVIEDEEQITTSLLNKLRKKYNAERVIVEYNGMWLLDKFLSAMPMGWIVYQQMMTADATTFLTYNANMRNLVYDKLQNSEFIIFNRFSDDIDKMALHKIARSASRGIAIAYEYKSGKLVQDDIIDPLPFDINADIIKIKDDDYAVWYADMIDDEQKYNGKTVNFKGLVAINKKELGDDFIIGRHVMNCCAADITYIGMPCKWEKTMELKMRDWVQITAEIRIENHKAYGEPGPVLYVKDIELSEKPENEVVTP
ncbi:MAG: TIGR03943 family protein [Clostridiales bacterium]|nr:TIGR03943 family protein [Clostridiales bacterium]